MGFASRWFSRSEETTEQQIVPPSARPKPATGRIVKEASAEILRAEAEQVATAMFGRRLHRAPSYWFVAPCAGIVTADFAGRRFPDSADEFCVSFAPGWGLGVLPELSPRFLVIEAKALVSGAWSGALEPGGEHLFDEVLALVELAKTQKIIPVFIDNAEGLSDQRPESFATASALEKLRSAVPAVIDAATVAEESSVAPSPVLQELFDYWQSSKEGI